MNDIGLNHLSAEPASLLARSAGSCRCPGSSPVKPSTCLGEPVSAAVDGVPADATKYQNPPIAEPAEAGPT